MANLRTQLTPLVLASVAAGIGLIVLVLASSSFIGSQGFAYDFQAYDLAARRIAAGEPLYPSGTAAAYNAGRFNGLYLYPPPLAIAFVPLTILSPDGAALAFFLGRIGLLALGCALLPVGRPTRLATFGVACLSLPVLYDINLGNMSVIVFVGASAIWRWEGRPLGSIILAGTIAFRPQFGILLLTWLVRRAFRPIAWAIVAGLVIGALTLPIVGVSAWFDYVTILRELGSISTGPHNLSLGSTAAAVGLGGSAGQLALYAGYAVAIAAVVFSALRRDANVAVVVGIMATLVLTPFVHSHYLTLLLVPTALLMDRGWWWAFALPLCGWLLPAEALPVLNVVAMLLPLLVGSRERPSPLLEAPTPTPAPAS